MDRTSTLSFFLLTYSLLPLRFVHLAMDSCYDDQTGTPSRCMPKFENVAFNRTVAASNVCGSPPEDYCMQTGSTRSCHHCDASDPERSHGPGLLTDFNRNEEPTWWQSQSMFYGIQHPNSVNLTLHLGKAFEITYIRLKFYASRPESFAIYKRTEENGPWLPFQFYSATCEETYRKDSKGYVRPGDDERMALCTNEFSDISPLTGGNVAFSTLEGRPSAYNFDQSIVLQEWVTASDLLVSLDRLNTFGDEVFKDATVLRSYFYAISDFSVGGRCKCNGHASECVWDDAHRGLVCACQHHTAGKDCERCDHFYQDRPWARATGEAANQCLKCNCSGRSDECVFDVEQYRSTGSGGRCVGCTHNTAGPHCQHCANYHYRSQEEEPCWACDCNVDGSVSLQCDSEGACACRVGVTGRKCDTCQPGFHSLGPGGCRRCECDSRGSVGDCSHVDGRCQCKHNVEGQSCDRCIPGFFNLQSSNPAGCQPCFCFGHSVVCSSSNQHAAFNITSDFLEDQDGWVGEFSTGQEIPLLWKEGEVYLLPLTEEDIGFYKAPEKFLGGRGSSYGRALSITFTSELSSLLPESVTVILAGSGFTLTADLSPQAEARHDPHHLTPTHTYSVRLHESEVRFRPQLSAFDFQRLLHNLTSVRISNAGGHNYTSQLAGVSLASAVIPSSGPALRPPPAPWVEVCSCPPGFAGLFCERCAPDFTRERAHGGALSTCVPCNCHRHGTCDPDTGVCVCSHSTAGPSCELCQDGYYGDAQVGSPSDCRPCPCPGQSSCAQVSHTGQVVCTDCPAGQTGTRCQMCEDGYHGDPLGQSGPVVACARCECNGNVDPNALAVCDHVTGRCLKCQGHTEGEHCERCQRGYYGDATQPHTAGHKCKPCSCNPVGTSGRVTECDPRTGSCQCLSHVTGRDCSYCEDGFFNLQEGVGCERCQCNPIGSSSPACHPITGQCVCRGGIKGRLCDFCRDGFYGFSSRGCRACNCDPMGSTSMQCHGNGTCLCRRGFVGYKCDKCESNYYHDRDTHQCEECPVCYGLVKKQAEKLKGRLQDLETLLSHFDCRGRGKQRRGGMLQYHMAKLYQHDNQREDALPNALEDFLAFQEAREAFIKQFSSLEASAGKLSAQLDSITSSLNCSLGEKAEDQDDGTACRGLAQTVNTVRQAGRQLQQATLDLDNMIIPFDLVSGGNKWNVMVNDSLALMKSHTETSERIQEIASGAANVSRQTWTLLNELLQDNSTEDYIHTLTHRITEMQNQKENLTAQVNETMAKNLALEQDTAALDLALRNITSSLKHLAPADTDMSPNQTHDPTNRTTQFGDNLRTQTENLDEELQTKDALISKLSEEMGPLKETIKNKMEEVDDITELRERAHRSKVAALSSVVTGKSIESDVVSLHRELQYMVRDLPRRQVQTEAAMKKERPLGAKVLSDVRRKVSQIEGMLKPALLNSSLASNLSKEAEETARAVAKESKSVLTQAKHTRTASSHLSSHLDSALLKLAEQERLTEAAKAQLNSAPVVSLSGVKENMEAARLQLKAYSATLTELISKIDANVPLERFDRILNETARRLAMLRGSVESPSLASKIQRLQEAATEQHGRMSLIEQELQDIREERDSLTDIAHTLPQACP